VGKEVEGRVPSFSSRIERFRKEAFLLVLESGRKITTVTLYLVEGRGMWEEGGPRFSFFVWSERGGKGKGKAPFFTLFGGKED